MRRRTLLVVLVGLAVVIAAGAVVVWPQPSRITKENCDRIHTEMTRAEVEAILGPPGDYRTGLGETAYGDDWSADPIADPPGTVWTWQKTPVGSPFHQECAAWLSDSYAICVSIDDTGQVLWATGQLRRTRSNPLQNLLWRAKRQWHRWFP
jgi:hypothetical protein